MTKEGAEDLATRACDYWNTTNAQLHAQLPVVNDTIGFTAGYLHDNLDPQYGRIVVMAGYSANERCNTTLNFNDADFHKKCGTGLYTAINGCKYFPCIAFIRLLLAPLEKERQRERK